MIGLKKRKSRKNTNVRSSEHEHPVQLYASHDQAMSSMFDLQSEGFLWNTQITEMVQGLSSTKMDKSIQIHPDVMKAAHVMKATNIKHQRIWV